MELEQKAKQAWVKAPYMAKLVFDHRILLTVPEQWWPEALLSMGNDRKERQNLRERGIEDEWGQFMLDPNFGKNPLLLGSGPGIFHGNAVEHECHYGQKDSPVIENLAMPTVSQGMQIWGKDYVVLPDGTHGPSKESLRNRTSKARYLRLSGHREKGSFS